MMLTVSAEAAFTVINGYAITTNTYATTSNWLAAVQAEFGASATVGTFEGLKEVFDADTSGLATLLGGGRRLGYLRWKPDIPRLLHTRERLLLGFHRRCSAFQLGCSRHNR